MTTQGVSHAKGHVPARNILGAMVASLSWTDGLALLNRLVCEHLFTPVGFLNAHSANVASADTRFLEALDHFLMLPDGIGVDIAARMLYGAPFPSNLNGTDFIPALLEDIPTPLSVGLLGASSQNVQAAAQALARRAPQHRYTVIHDGFFHREEEAGVLDAIEALHPDMLLVAMGVPRQEMWINANITERHCTMPVAVGALFDFLSGAIPRAPSWMRRLRLEWVYRLALEPMRLWRRYILGNPLFLVRVMRQKMGRHRGRP